MQHLQKGNAGNTTSCDTSSVDFFEFGNSAAVLASDVPERAKIRAISAKITLLRDFASQDGYGLNPASQSDFLRFLELESRWRRGDLVLMDNGILRAVWKNGKGTCLSLQFLGDGKVQFVIFRRQARTLSVSRVTGRDSFEGLKRQICSFELDSLVCE